MLKSNVNNCSQLVRIFALSSCAFCSRTIRNFALEPYAILLSDRTQFCSWTVRNFALGPYAILLSDRCSYSILLSNRCSYPRPTGPPYVADPQCTDLTSICWYLDDGVLAGTRASLITAFEVNQEHSVSIVVSA